MSGTGKASMWAYNQAEAEAGAGLELGSGLGFSALCRVSMCETLIPAISIITEQKKASRATSGVIFLCVFYMSAVTISPFLQHT